MMHGQKNIKPLSMAFLLTSVTEFYIVLFLDNELG